MPKALDLTGQKFGRLTVAREAPLKFTSGGNRKRCWYCDCDCGTKNKIISTGELRSGRTQSCGCLNDENIRKPKNRKENEYDLTSHPYGVGYTAKGEEFWFDLEDYDLIKGRRWRIHNKYVVAEGRMELDGTTKEIFLHRLVMRYEGDDDVDHIITEDKFDNRKCNLRIVSRSQNNMNKVKQKNNTSGIPGVYFHNTKQVWRATININKKHKQFNCHTFEEAVALRKYLVDKYYGDYSYEKSQDIGLINDAKEYLRLLRERD